MQQNYVSGDLTVPSSIASGMLVLALVVHQTGHYLASSRLGDPIVSMVIFPFGGRNSFANRPPPSSLIRVHLAGPLANVIAGSVFVAVALACQIDLGEFARRPLLPAGLIEGAPWQVAIKTGIWLQWMLAMINSLPCGPFDAAMAFKALAVQRHPQDSVEFEQKWLRWGACATACMLTLVAVTRFNSDVYEPIAFWLPLILMAMLLVFAAGMERTTVAGPRAREQNQASYARHALDQWSGDTDYQREDSRDDEFASSLPDFDGDDDEEFTPVTRDTRASDTRASDTRASDSPASDNDDVVRLDSILDKLHREGRDGLSADEIDFLEQASRRFRQRSGGAS